MFKPPTRLLSQAKHLRAILGIIAAVSLAACTRPATARPVPASENASSQGGTPGVTATDFSSFPAVQQTSVAQTATARASGGTVLPTVAFTPRPLMTATAPPGSSPQPSAAPTSASTAQTYVVQDGDTLFSIALNFGLTVEELAQANNISDPGSIYAGQELIIPAGGSASATAVPVSTSTGQQTYTVQDGDNCFRVALDFGLTCEQLAVANGLTPPYFIYPGQVLVIPQP
jgi:lysozyme